MAIPSLGEMLEGLRDWVARHPKLTGRFMFWALLGAVAGVGLLFAAGLVMLVSLAWGVSRELALLMGTLTLAFWLYAAALLFTLRNTDHRYSRQLKRWIHNAEQGEATSRWKLVEAYRDGSHGARRDLAAHGWWLRKLAETGDASAMMELARLLKEGRGLLRDRVQARLWLDRAAQAGYAPAVELQTEWDHVSEGDGSGSEG